METFLSCVEECLFVVIVNFYRVLLRFLSKDLEALILIDLPDIRSESDWTFFGRVKMTCFQNFSENVWIFGNIDTYFLLILQLRKVFFCNWTTICAKSQQNLFFLELNRFSYLWIPTSDFLGKLIRILRSFDSN